MPDHTTLITRTAEEDEAMARKMARLAADEIRASVAALRHQARLDTGTCYTDDLAWLWECSTDTVRRRMRAADVAPIDTSGQRHLWDVETACRAWREA